MEVRALIKPKRKQSGPDGVVTPAPVVQHREPVVHDRGHGAADHVVPDHRFWPAGKPLPTAYHRPPQPCPECRRLLTDDGGRAAMVTTTSMDGRIVSFKCKCCHARWKLPKSE